MGSGNIVLILLVLLGISAANATTQTSASELAHSAGASALEELFRLRRLVENENACALPGCTIKYDSFLTCMRRAVSRGYVHVRHAEFVEHGLTHGFDCGVQRELLFGKRVFSNYKSAEEARSSVTKAIQSRLKKGKSLALGAWSVVETALKAAGVDTYFLFPMGAVAKKDSPDPTNPIMRPTDDHSKTGLNKATCMDHLRYALKTYAEVAWLLKKDYFMYVSDVEDAFLLLPLAPWLWFFMLFRCFLSDDDAQQTTCVHLFGDFGTCGMPGTFYIFFVKVVVQMGRSEMVLTLPIAIYVDDCGIIGPDKLALDTEVKGFQAWNKKTTGVEFKVSKDSEGAKDPHMIGFGWDSRSLTRSLEEVKLHGYLADLLRCGESPTLTLRDRQEMAGKMERGVMVLPPGARCFVANCFAMMARLIHGGQRRRTSRAERQDYLLVHDLLRFCQGRGYYSYDGFAQGPSGLGDASKSRKFTGGGYVVSDGFYDFFEYGSAASRNIIDALEGDVVRRALAERGSGWQGQVISWGIDNSAYQLSQAKGRSKAPRLNEICRDIFYLQLKAGCVMSTYWLASEDNLLPDHLSRSADEGHGEAAFLAATEALGGFLAPGAVLQRHPQAGRVVTFADHEHLARELRSGVTSGRWAAPSGMSPSPPPSPPAEVVGGLQLRLVSRAEERAAHERAWDEAMAEAAEVESRQRGFERQVAEATPATPGRMAEQQVGSAPGAPRKGEAPTPLRMARGQAPRARHNGGGPCGLATVGLLLLSAMGVGATSSTSRVGGSLVQQLSVPYSRASVFDGLPMEFSDSLDEIMDTRLAETSMAKVASAVRRWTAYAQDQGTPILLVSDDPLRGGRLAGWVLSMVQDTELVFASISTYVWALRTWHQLQHQADPALGVMGWSSFMTSVAVRTAVAAEPRKEVPLAVVRAILEHIEREHKDVFEWVQFAFLMLLLLFTFSRSETPCPKTFGGFDKKKHWSWGDICPDRYQDGWVMGVLFRGIKQDPRCERPTARGGDWAVVGDVPGSIFSVMLWYKRLVQLGGVRETSEPFFLARDRTRPYTYSCALSDFRTMLAAVGADETLGLHGLRVLGYNLSLRGNGEGLTVAQGGWLSEAHDRYARWGPAEVIGIPAGMIGVERMGATATDMVREIRRAPGPRSARAAAPAAAAAEVEDAAGGEGAQAPDDEPVVGVLVPPGYEAERRDATARSYTVWRAPDGTVCPSRPAAWRHYEGRDRASEPSPRYSSTGRERPSGGARPTPRRARRTVSVSTPAQASGGDGSPTHGAAGLEGSSSGSLAVAMASVSVADQQVEHLEDAVTYWERGTSSRRPPTERG
jgi:hypothetical protein